MAAGWRFEQKQPGYAWRARDSRRGVKLKDTFQGAAVKYFKRETKRLRQELRSPSTAKLPRAYRKAPAQHECGRGSSAWTVW